MTENSSDDIGRRAALKTAAAAGVAAVVWAEPTIKGLARRPAYADTGSGAPVTLTNVVITGTINADASITNILVDGVAQPAGGVTIGNQTFLIGSDPNGSLRPRLQVTNPSGPNGLLAFTAATYDSGPGGPEAMDAVGIISNNQRRLRFARLTGAENGMTGDFQITFTIQCG